MGGAGREGWARRQSWREWAGEGDSRGPQKKATEIPR